jgi:hypothetical protein
MMHSAKSVGIFSQYDKLLEAVLTDSSKVISSSMTCMPKSQMRVLKKKEANVQFVYDKLSVVLDRVLYENSTLLIEHKTWKSFAQKVEDYSKIRRSTVPPSLSTKIQKILDNVAKESRKKEATVDPEAFFEGILRRQTPISLEEIKILSGIPIENLSLDRRRALLENISPSPSHKTAKELIERISESVQRSEYEIARRAIDKGKNPEKLARFS